MISRRVSLPLVAVFSAFFVSNTSAQTKLLRFPDIHGDEVAFTYGGDLWTAPVAGGTAVRLTSHPGIEVFAKFSPDGKWIAFTGQYDGDEQVYVMPAAGGVPKQLTFYPARGPLTPRSAFGPYACPSAATKTFSGSFGSIRIRAICRESSNPICAQVFPPSVDLYIPFP